MLRFREWLLTSAAAVLQTLTREFVWDAGTLWSQVLGDRIDVADCQTGTLHVTCMVALGTHVWPICHV